jgi:DNA-binding transcriptional LysR family regulator
LLLTGDCDIALVAMSSYPTGLRQRLVRCELLRLAVSTEHPLAEADQVELSTLKDEHFEIWPRQTAPRYYDVVVGACRVAGFEPLLDDDLAGATVWCDAIARGRGVGMMVSSALEQLASGLALVDLAPPRPTLAINALWAEDGEQPAVTRFLDAANSVATENGWY